MQTLGTKHVAEVKTPYATLQIVGRAPHPRPIGAENFYTKLVRGITGATEMYQFKVVDVKPDVVQGSDPTEVKRHLEQALTDLVGLPETRTRFGLLKIDAMKQMGTLRSRLYAMVNHTAAS